MLVREMDLVRVEMHGNTISVMLINPDHVEDDNAHGKQWDIDKDQFLEWSKITERLSQIMTETLNAYAIAVRSQDVEYYQEIIQRDWSTEELAYESSCRHLIEGLESHSSTSLSILFDYLQFSEDQNKILNHKQIEK